MVKGPSITITEKSFAFSANYLVVGWTKYFHVKLTSFYNKANRSVHWENILDKSGFLIFLSVNWRDDVCTTMSLKVVRPTAIHIFCSLPACLFLAHLLASYRYGFGNFYLKHLLSWGTSPLSEQGFLNWGSPSLWFQV